MESSSCSKDVVVVPRVRSEGARERAITWAEVAGTVRHICQRPSSTRSCLSSLALHYLALHYLALPYLLRKAHPLGQDPASSCSLSFLCRSGRCAVIALFDKRHVPPCHSCPVDEYQVRLDDTV